jgi:hypothetical protein
MFRHHSHVFGSYRETGARMTAEQAHQPVRIIGTIGAGNRFGERALVFIGEKPGGPALVFARNGFEVFDDDTARLHTAE